MIKKEIEEKLLELFKNIKDRPVIVEGKRDKKVLRSFKFTKIFTIEKGLYETSLKLKKFKKIMIFTDFDREGKEINKKLTLFLQSQGCKVDIVSRKKLKTIFAKLRIRTIEELKSLR
ncbi:MAG: toprim domain-containing protein [Candidatus Aenigmatarchaeota archaeon]